jgi:hypothetical protein
MDSELELKQSLISQFELVVPDTISREELKSALTVKLNHLIQNDFHQLVFILYRIDVNESKLRRMLQDSPSEDAGRILADLILERQSQKIMSRAQYKQTNDTDEDEKW